MLRRAMRLPILFAVLVPLSLAACSGNVVVEPIAKTTKRAKAFLEKCEPPPLPEGEDGDGFEEVYACLPLEDACPAPDDPVTKEELGYLLNKEGECSNWVRVYDVPCGPDLNAIDCCYAVRIESSSGLCL